MTNRKLSFFILGFFLSLSVGCCGRDLAGPPVAVHGRLRVEGTQLVNESETPVQLCGMSSFWLNWEEGEFANAESIVWLKKDWGISVFRAAMGVEEDGGYLEQPDAMVSRVDEIVAACVEQGIYVIIDYHSHYASEDLEAAKRFFDRMSRKYGHLPHVIYEVWNEPKEVSWSEDIKPYMEEVIPVIRKHDPDNIILCGTPWWSAHPDKAADDWLNASNTMAVVHFYAGTHEQSFRDRADYALEKGVPLFVSEFGTTIYDGGQGEDRKLYLEEASRWMKWMDENKISWVNWSLGDKDEASAALLPGASKQGGWSVDEISGSGAYARQQLLRRQAAQ